MSETPNLFRLLEIEWQAEAQGLAARAALRRWQLVEPSLADLTSPAAVVRRCQQRDFGHSQAILIAVLRQGADDPWAARTVLQAVLPGLAAISRRAAVFVGGGWPVWQTLDDLDQHVVVVAIERIAALATSPPPWPARAIVDGTWQRVRAYTRRVRRQAHRQSNLDTATELGVAGGRTAEEDIAIMLADAVARGRLDTPDADLIRRSRLGGERVEDIAQSTGVAARSLWRRRATAERRFVAEVFGLDDSEARQLVTTLARGA